MILLVKQTPQVNGLRGFVRQFVTCSRGLWALMPQVEWEDGSMSVVTPSVERNSGFSRIQLPMNLAFALTIHKAQGMGIDPLVVDLSNVWCAGQAYVALSRAARREGLQVKGFPTKRIFCNDEVLEF